MVANHQVFLVDMQKNIFQHIWENIQIYNHIQDYKDVADKDLYEGVENKLMYKELLETLYDDTLLITSDMYERYFFNTPGDERIRTQDVFFTNSLSKGMLFKVLRSHPKYKSFKDEVKRI